MDTDVNKVHPFKEYTLNVLYNTKETIVLGDYMDLILNSDNDAPSIDKNSLDQANYRKYNYTGNIHNNNIDKIGKFQLYEFIKNSSSRGAGIAQDHDNRIYNGGITLPRVGSTDDEGSEGSGNIVITGLPGVGKSTLAFQIAAACASEINQGISIYYSLEVNDIQMKNTMIDSRDSIHVSFLKSDNKNNIEQSTESLKKSFKDFLKNETGKKDGTILPQVLIATLTPRGVSEPVQMENDSLFIQRYNDLVLLLKIVSLYNKEIIEGKTDIPKVKTVIIDSLNVFGDRPLQREQISSLFSLFKKYRIIGIFTLGGINSEYNDYNMIDMYSVMYLADVILKLSREEYNNYVCGYLEVIKSRFDKHVRGRQAYKILPYKKQDKKQEYYPFGDLALIKYVKVLPSLYYRINVSDPIAPIIRTKEEYDDVKKSHIFGSKLFNRILPKEIQLTSLGTPQIISITGGSGLYKSDLAINALISGISQHNVNGLILRMNDRGAFGVHGAYLHRDTLLQKDQTSEKIPLNLYERDAIISEKYVLNSWSKSEDKKIEASLFEAVFKSDALFPEEFIESLCGIIFKHKICRIAFIDVKSIGVNYPFFMDSKTSGDTFFSSFIHIMRNYGVHIIFTSSESSYEKSDTETQKINSLSDGIIRVRSVKIVDLLIDTKKFKGDCIEITGEEVDVHNKNKLFLLPGYKSSDDNGNDNGEISIYKLTNNKYETDPIASEYLDLYKLDYDSNDFKKVESCEKDNKSSKKRK